MTPWTPWANPPSPLRALLGRGRQMLLLGVGGGMGRDAPKPQAELYLAPPVYLGSSLETHRGSSSHKKTLAGP